MGDVGGRVDGFFLDIGLKSSMSGPLRYPRVIGNLTGPLFRDASGFSEAPQEMAFAASL